jgi:hypothetical protein
MHEHEANKSELRAETQPHSVGHNTEVTCNVAQAAPSAINTTYHSLKSRHKLTTLHAPSRCSRRRRPYSQPVRVRPGGQDDPHTVALCPSLVSYHVNRCHGLGPVVVRPRRRQRGYILRGLDNNAGFGTGVMGLTLEVVRMAHQCRRPIANGCVLGSKSTIGIIRGETLWVGASSSSGRGGRAHVRQHWGVVGVARGGIPVEVTKLSLIYNLFSLLRTGTFFLVFLGTQFHKGGNRVCIAASRT